MSISRILVVESEKTPHGLQITVLGSQVGCGDKHFFHFRHPVAATQDSNALDMCTQVLGLRLQSISTGRNCIPVCTPKGEGFHQPRAPEPILAQRAQGTPKLLCCFEIPVPFEQGLTFAQTSLRQDESIHLGENVGLEVNRLTLSDNLYPRLGFLRQSLLGGIDNGAAWVYTRNTLTGTWEVSDILMGIDGNGRESSISFGWSLDLDGDVAVVGAKEQQTGRVFSSQRVPIQFQQGQT